MYVSLPSSSVRRWRAQPTTKSKEQRENEKQIKKTNNYKNKSNKRHNAACAAGADRLKWARCVRERVGQDHRWRTLTLSQIQIMNSRDKLITLWKQICC
jgi:hypothetical protein